jgi:hypothetical protein
MSRSGPILKLKRYTQLPQLLHLLSTRKLATLNPSTWPDQNDTTYLSRYKAARPQVTGLYVLCMTEAADTFHHWNVFASGPTGVKLEFDPVRFQTWLQSRREKFSFERVQYKRLDQIEAAAREVDSLPFLKRKAFRDENEIRLLIEDTEPNRDVRLLEGFDLSVIRKISLSPWLPKTLVETVVSALRAVYAGTESQWEAMKVRRTSLLSNDTFRSAGR